MANIDLDKIKAQKKIEELIRFGIINVDKPSGPTSFGVDEIIKNKLKLNKTSHFGTLDPKVTGVLPVALGRACRLMNYFIGRNKEYVGVMRVHTKIDERKLKSEVQKFIGKIKQLPPVKSRVKRQEREREVFSFDIIEIKNQDILFKTEVQAGTYIRKLIHDIGNGIGGAHMIELRRTKASIFEEDKSYDIYEVLDAIKKYKSGNDKKLREMIVPGEAVSIVLPVVQIKYNKKTIKQLLTGKPLFKKEVMNKIEGKKDDKIALFSGQKLVGIYKIINEGETLAKPEFVFN